MSTDLRTVRRAEVYKGTRLGDTHAPQETYSRDIKELYPAVFGRLLRTVSSVVIGTSRRPRRDVNQATEPSPYDAQSTNLVACR